MGLPGRGGAGPDERAMRTRIRRFLRRPEPVKSLDQVRPGTFLTGPDGRLYCVTAVKLPGGIFEIETLADFLASRLMVGDEYRTMAELLVEAGWFRPSSSTVGVNELAAQLLDLIKPDSYHVFLTGSGAVTIARGDCSVFQRGLR